MCVEVDGSLLDKPVCEQSDQIVTSFKSFRVSQGSALWLPLLAQSDKHAEKVKQIMPLLV